MPQAANFFQPLWQTLMGLLDGKARNQWVQSQPDEDVQRVQWLNTWPFVFLHLGCFLVFWVGFSWTGLWVCVGMYFVRMFAITGFYHRYFSHRTFKTSRIFQFLMGVLGNSSVQKGPLWWAAHHRDHHRHSDQPVDLHSPVQRGFWYSHLGWITVEKNLYTKYNNLPDFSRFPELIFINRYDWLVPLLYAILLYGTGSVLSQNYPSLNTSGAQLLVWGWFISTTLLFHGTCTINSLSHVFGSQRYNTGDQSRNNFYLALITLGEGWHNNHHQYPGSTRQGFYWWEIDITYYILKALEAFGIVWDLHPVPLSIRENHTAKTSGKPFSPLSNEQPFAQPHLNTPSGFMS